MQALAAAKDKCRRKAKDSRCRKYASRSATWSARGLFAAPVWWIWRVSQGSMLQPAWL